MSLVGRFTAVCFESFNKYMVRKITALKLQKRNRQRVNVFLDGEFAFGLSRIVAAWLEVGQELNDEKIAQLREDDTLEIAYQQALKYIGYRIRSEAEVQNKLTEYGFSEEVTTEVNQRLHRNGIVDDERFAQAWIENRIEFRPRSHRALSFELRQKGIAKDIIDKTLTNTTTDEELAYLAAARQCHKLIDLEWPEFRRKLSGYLTRRGFSYNIVATVVDRVWAEQRSNKTPG